MTWQTVKGNRTLCGAEATLFAACLATMIDFDMDSESKGMNYNDPLVNGPFEDLTPAQKYTVMEEVAHALLNDTANVPELTAINESSIYYVFMWLQSQIEEDVETGAEIWGPMILAAIETEIETQKEETGDVEEEDESYWPSLGCLDFKKWETAIDCSWNKILHDLDFEMYKNPAFHTVSGDMSSMYATMDIAPGYFAQYQGRAKKGARERLHALVCAVPGVMGEVEPLQVPVQVIEPAQKDPASKRAKRK